VALRHPQGPAASLISRFGKPLAAPSANRSGKISPTTAKHVQAEFGEELLVLDGGDCAIGLESTILKIDGEKIILLRPGAITPDMIKDVTDLGLTLPTSQKIEAPGMMKSHYAPNAQLRLNCETCEPEPNTAWLQFGAVDATHQQCANLSVTGDLREAAANLYADLKRLDEKGVTEICVSPIPNEGLGIAINDRLERAAAPRTES